MLPSMKLPEKKQSKFTTRTFGRCRESGWSDKGKWGGNCQSLPEQSCTSFSLVYCYILFWLTNFRLIFENEVLLMRIYQKKEKYYSQERESNHINSFLPIKQLNTFFLFLNINITKYRKYNKILIYKKVYSTCI